MSIRKEWIVQMTVMSFSSLEDAEEYAHDLSDDLGRMIEEEGLSVSVRYGEAIVVEAPRYVH